jgi:hypothetical protein
MFLCYASVLGLFKRRHKAFPPFSRLIYSKAINYRKYLAVACTKGIGIFTFLDRIQNAEQKMDAKIKYQNQRSFSLIFIALLSALN